MRGWEWCGGGGRAWQKRWWGLRGACGDQPVGSRASPMGGLRLLPHLPSPRWCDSSKLLKEFKVRWGQQPKVTLEDQWVHILPAPLNTLALKLVALVGSFLPHLHAPLGFTCKKCSVWVTIYTQHLGRMQHRGQSESCTRGRVLGALGGHEWACSKSPNGRKPSIPMSEAREVKQIHR